MRVCVECVECGRVYGVYESECVWKCVECVRVCGVCEGDTPN